MGAHRRSAGIACALIALLPLSGCSRTGETPPPPAAQEAAPAVPCRPAPLTERAAAVLVAGLPGTLRPGDPLVKTLTDLRVGGVLVTARNVQDTAQVSGLTAALRERSDRPLLITTDEEGGQVSSFKPLFGSTPSAYSVGDQSPAALFAKGRQLGQYLRKHGVNGNLAPVADVTTGTASKIGSRSYSAKPKTASADALAVARGLSAAGVVPTIKHFPGLGRPEGDTHRELAVVDTPRAEFEASDLAPFVDAIRAGIPAVMVSHAAYPSLGINGEPASVSPATYALLRELGFTGVAMTDSLGMGAVNLRYDYPEAAVRALVAGADALLFTDGTQAKRMRDAITSAVQNGRLDAARLDEAAARVTALAGGDPKALACRDVSLPTLKG